MAAQVDGTVEIEGVAAERQVIAISYKQFDNGSGVGHHVVGADLSDAGDGSYSISWTGYDDEVILIALDDYGKAWTPNTSCSIGDIIHPTAGNETGYVYRCTVAGVTGATEPAWWADTGSNDTGAVGTATFAAYQAYRPLAHAPVMPTITAGSNPNFDQFTASLNPLIDLDFEEASGTVTTDLSGNGNDFNLSGSVTYSIDSGWAGAGLGFRLPAAPYVTRADPDVFNDLSAGAILVAFAIDGSTGDQQTLFCYGDSASSDWFCRLGILDDGAVRWTIRKAGGNAGQYNTETAAGAIPFDGTPHTLQLVHDGVRPKLYLDKTEITLTDQITNIDPSTFLNQLSGAELVTFGMLTRNADTQPINGVLYRGVVAATAPSAQQAERWHNGAVTGTASTD